MALQSKSPSLHILAIFLIFLSGSHLSMCLTLETQALLEFKRQLIDPLNYLESWKESDSPCHFYGITCDQETGLVTEISLDNKSLSGNISPSLSVLQNLTSLALPSNLISGVLPGELSKCINLKVLNVSDNYLNGSVPDFSMLTNLEILDLSDNSFSGAFPSWVGNLTGLVSLGLGDNDFDEGEIPESLGNLKNLYWLYLAGSNLTGEIPESIFELEGLGTLDICKNKISGNFPTSIIKLKNLFKIELYQNNLTGEIPAGLANLTLLEEFDISANQMSGTIPHELGNLKKLTVFHLNSFTGEFPQNLGRYSPLNSIDISENKFSGAFPKYLCQNGNLEKLLALENNFSGGFPDTYAECKPLVRLRISQNQLDGTIPDGIWSLPNVQVIDVCDNYFTGGISPGIGAALQLNELMLSNNRFSGELPRDIGMLTQLERIYLDNNNFSGRIPSELGALKQISSLYLEANALTGSIPSELADCPRLVDLNLASNFLSGSIPSSFSKMASLNSLNLSSNRLTGSIPRNFDKLKLSSVDLSNNHLSGSIPPYFLTVAGDKAFLGNKGLCVDDDESGTKNFKQSEADKHLGDEKGIHSNWKLENFQQLEFDVDEICDMDEDNLIGSGSTGKVYRVDLKKGCGTVAVKQLWKGNGVKLMEAEMDILGKIRHRNILKLYACLMKGGSNFLVFEYMANGNLFQALHREIKAGRAELDWYQRWRIAVGAAKGIAYLHLDCCPPIIHRDIKSTNILLDEDYEAKIADFGVAKVADQVSPGGSELSCFAGTHGYIAPEMAYSIKVTEKSDVYSFGVVLLELVTGKKPIEEDYGEGKDLVYWVSTHLNNRENVLKVLDHKVATELVQDDMIKVLKIATLCTSKLPNLRPSMKEVVKMLIDAEPCSFRSPDNFGKNEKAYL
ncbi:UNVERIFIED_CONTAM: Receptor protein-tyrosine kinase CEPR2 [Sesamum radiatum]|uniref:non-specific serine/threonine protein kinase n=1 Tax=Sesamum radiatum TaxID=300843 RepID=A0AAW2PX33_SESRA